MMNSKITRYISRILFLVCAVAFGYNFLKHYEFTKKINSRELRVQHVKTFSPNVKGYLRKSPPPTQTRPNQIQHIEIGNDILKEINENKLDCEYASIGKNFSHADDEVKCKLVQPNEEDCNAAQRSYGDMPKDRTCHEGRGTKFADICVFANTSFRTSSEMNLKLHCDTSVCKDSPIFIGAIHPVIGVLPDMEQWAVAKGKKELVSMLNVVIKDVIKGGFDYVFLGCKVDKRTVKQVLVLPPLMKFIDTGKDYRKSAINANINIIVLDSVSREHFFRRLPATAENLKMVNNNDKIGASVLDFELFQSVAPRTFPNIRALFSGEVDKDTDDTDHSYEIGNLFSAFIEHGYQTMLQEDSCWFDSWGAIITDNVHNLTPLTATEHFVERWTNLNKRLRKMQVNSFGLTHLTCDVLLRYGVTNQFNEPQKVCYNGRLLTTYFLDYVKSHFILEQKQEFFKPLLLYTHLNTGHEKSGKRIGKSDPELADFVAHAARMKDTITILLSDHGPKTTQFARENDRGRYELAHSFLFMIIPEKIRNSLGKKFDALVLNQKRLITPKDLHFTLTSFLLGGEEGLLQPIDSQRGCKDLPLYSFTHCLCSGWILRLPDAERSIAWIAEFALGHLNNMIQAMYKSKVASSKLGGYGNCERLIGIRFINIKTRREEERNIYNFDIVVYRYRGAEMFEFAISEDPQYVKTGGLLRTLQWRRVSIFQHFRKCLDKGVLPDLCICRPESSGKNPGRDLTHLLASKFFNVRTTTVFLDSRCLALLTRTRSKSHRAYEVTNLCVDRAYSFRFDIVRDAFHPEQLPISTLLPVNITVAPWTIHFLASISLRNYDDADINKAGKLEIIEFFKV